MTGRIGGPADRRIDTPGTTAAPGAPSAEKQALIEAFDQVIKADTEQRERAPEVQRAPRRWPLHPVAVLALLLLAGVGAWIGATRPSWLLERGMPVENAAMQDASLRLAMAMQFQRIERYRSTNRRLPASLAEVGPPMQGITYERAGSDQYVLRGRNGGASLMLRSTDPVKEFVGSSYTLIQGRGQR